MCSLYCFLSLFFFSLVNMDYFSNTGAWTTNAQCILCLWTRMKTWLLRRSQWPCTQTTCPLVASPTRTCRWEYAPQKTWNICMNIKATKSKILISIIVVCFMSPLNFSVHFWLLQTGLLFYLSLFLSHYYSEITVLHIPAKRALLIIHSSQSLLVWYPGHMMFHTAKTVHL